MTIPSLLVGPWAWVSLGLLMAAAEIVVPGVFLIWIGIAAIVTGIVEAIFHVGLTWSLVVLAFASLASVLIGRRIYGAPEQAGDQPFLNRRADALIGREFVLDHPIEQGIGRIRVDDSVWRVSGPDLPIGARVKVVDARGGVDLRVEKV